MLHGFPASAYSQSHTLHRLPARADRQSQALALARRIPAGVPSQLHHALHRRLSSRMQAELCRPRHPRLTASLPSALRRRTDGISSKLRRSLHVHLHRLLRDQHRRQICSHQPCLLHVPLRTQLTLSCPLTHRSRCAIHPHARPTRTLHHRPRTRPTRTLHHRPRS